MIAVRILWRHTATQFGRCLVRGGGGMKRTGTRKANSGLDSSVLANVRPLKSANQVQNR